LARLNRDTLTGDMATLDTFVAAVTARRAVAFAFAIKKARPDLERAFLCLVRPIRRPAGAELPRSARKPAL
jgi:hypothetical protein